ncbi:hypothetical protein BKA82DRAFT_1001658 [Pisolithus tinctorius]|uniref:Uncharacterized protein n=1 Tax=Pisolithus tinctorius Marx 270 TaxID=870435 RepID=A0A0C3NQ80_PISTI|nr:hypothetical protein BKA82DRAFT_1001658 [Pisolithus tinctorius]KIO03030.1 hypothetical protein M404DRAFT_1001658 [Pisolithus tinctorius Marx 270]
MGGRAAFRKRMVWCAGVTGEICSSNAGGNDTAMLMGSALGDSDKPSVSSKSLMLAGGVCHRVRFSSTDNCIDNACSSSGVLDSTFLTTRIMTQLLKERPPQDSQRKYA